MVFMILDGIFLFKLYALGTLYELFAHKHMSIQVQNSRLDRAYQLQWYRYCIAVIRKGCLSRTSTSMELINFCDTLFHKFFISNKRVFKNDKLRAQIFHYTTKCDRDNGFNIVKFLKLLHMDMNGVSRCGINTINNATMTNFRQELIELLEHVEYIKSLNDDKYDLIITFQDWKKYKSIFAFITLQYEYSFPHDNETKFNLFAFVNIYNQLDFNTISS